MPITAEQVADNDLSSAPPAISPMIALLNCFILFPFPLNSHRKFPCPTTIAELPVLFALRLTAVPISPIFKLLKDAIDEFSALLFMTDVFRAPPIMELVPYDSDLSNVYPLAPDIFSIRMLLNCSICPLIISADPSSPTDAFALAHPIIDAEFSTLFPFVFANTVPETVSILALLN